MSLGKALTERLRALTQEGAQPGMSEVTVGAATVRLFDHDRYSATLQELVVGAAMPEGEEMQGYLSGHAAAIARRLSFLEEPLAVWELDSGEGVVQLRSSPPLREGEELSYWEVQLSAAIAVSLPSQSASARLARFRWIPGVTEREPVAYPATFALLGRLADALEAALNEGNE